MNLSPHMIKDRRREWKIWVLRASLTRGVRLTLHGTGALVSTQNDNPAETLQP